jgi:hypothetical protein
MKLNLMFFTVLGSLISGIAQAASPADVFNYFNQNLPKDGQYYSQDKSCTVVIDRSMADDIKVNVVANSEDGAVGIFNDDSQKIDTYKQKGDSVQLKTETQAMYLKAYGVLSVEQIGSSLVTFSAGSMQDMLNKNPQMVTCAVVIE